MEPNEQYKQDITDGLYKHLLCNIKTKIGWRRISHLFLLLTQMLIMITNIAVRYSGLIYKGEEEQEESKILGRKTEASKNITPTTHWTSFHGFSIVTSTTNWLCFTTITSSVSH
jgi:hypothetical protein